MNSPLRISDEQSFSVTLPVNVQYQQSENRTLKTGIQTADPFLELVQNVIFPVDLPQRRCVQLTAAHKGAGVTRTCHSMAATLTAMGKSVLVVSAADLLHIATSQSESLLNGSTKVENGHFSLLTRTVPLKPSDVVCGLPPAADADPAALARRAVEALLEQFDFVIVDAPPLDTSSAALIVARAVSGTILVVEAGRSRKKHLVQAAARLEVSHSSLLGFVLNKRTYSIPSWLYRWL